ncbi:MAG: 4Fe-4S binding protein [Firmicutes bacterium]|nr:4Fe-4S binding protein [Bacillota bacterium]
MCEFCTKHGEGKKWYEIMENYSRELLNDPGRRTYIEQFVPRIRSSGKNNLERLEWVKRKIPIAHRFIRKIATVSAKKFHFGQVVPLEDAEKIVEMVQSVTRVPCVCRTVLAGKSNARYCLLLGINPTDYSIDWPELKENLEVLTPSEAKLLLREFDRQGLVHSIWTLKSPFIGAICNCDRDCLAYRYQVGSDLLEIMFKAEYRAKIDMELCVGCRNCMSICQFGAVEYSVTHAKCYINTEKCYGCGLCRVACKKQAIELYDISPLPLY